LAAALNRTRAPGGFGLGLFQGAALELGLVAGAAVCFADGFFVARFVALVAMGA